jgi:VIT1/CCC1 family predicted Fe2+/Mn2+ transporter
MLIGALGCNLAWGVVDAVMYLMAGVMERARGVRTLNEVRKASDAAAAQCAIASSLPPLIAAVLEPPELESIRIRLAELPEPPDRVRLDRDHWLAALAIFLWVFFSTFPVVTPFIFIHDPTRALYVSNAIAVIMLFVTGHSLGRYAGKGPWLTGLSMVLLGVALVTATVALGG